MAGLGELVYLEIGNYFKPHLGVLGASVLIHRLLLAPLHPHGGLSLLGSVHGTFQDAPPVIIAHGLQQGHHDDYDQR